MTKGQFMSTVAIAIYFYILWSSQPSTFNNPNKHIKDRKSCKCGSPGGVMELSS